VAVNSQKNMKLAVFETTYSSSGTTMISIAIIRKDGVPIYETSLYTDYITKQGAVIQNDGSVVIAL